MARFIVLPLFASLALAYPGSRLETRQSNLCAFVGYDLGIKAYFVANGTGDATSVSCSDRCASNAACQSFAIGSGNCLLYNLTVYVEIPAPSSTVSGNS